MDRKVSVRLDHSQNGATRSAVKSEIQISIDFCPANHTTLEFMAPRRRCPTCGSKQWHKEPLSGFIACSEGHILQARRNLSSSLPPANPPQNYRNEATEADEWGTTRHAETALKSRREIKGRESNANSRRMFFLFFLEPIGTKVSSVYHGARGRYLYFQSLQLLLRHQVAVLTDLWALPAEFEVIHTPS